jgi:hypothetical protein
VKSKNKISQLVLWAAGVVLVLLIPLLLFSVSPEKTGINNDLEKRSYGSLYLTEDEDFNEDPRVMYEPDLREGFSQWVFDSLVLPPLDRPDLRMGTPNFYSRDDFPQALNSPVKSLEQKIRDEWPMPTLQDEKDFETPSLKINPRAFIILADGVEQTELISQAEFDLAIKDMPEASITHVSIFAITIKQTRAEVSLIKTCGWRALDNLLGKKIFAYYNEEIIRESILSGEEIESTSSEVKYLAEWRTGLTKTKK